MTNQEKSSSSPSEEISALDGAPAQKPTLLDKLWSRLQIARDRLVDRNLRNRLIIFFLLLLFFLNNLY
jgi:hypothetical protein